MYRIYRDRRRIAGPKPLLALRARSVRPPFRLDATPCASSTAEVAVARGDLETARSSATMAVRLAPKEHVETRAEALLALATLALVEERTEEAQSLIGGANAVIAPTEYHDLRERARRMAGLVAARAPAS
jgi:hypothetical protein